MLYALLGTSAGKTRDEIMAVYPRHKTFMQPFADRGDIVGIGPFLDGDGGNMALFRSREAAEEFAKGDPFILEGMVKSWSIKAWGDVTLT